MDERLREVESILRAKEDRRLRRAKMTFEEKIEIVDRLRSLDAGFGGHRKKKPCTSSSPVKDR